MHIVVFGAGSLGCALGGLLSREHRVSLVGRKPIVEAVSKRGLRVVGDRRLAVWPSAAETVDHFDSPELLVVTTKAYDTGEAVRACRSAVSSRTMVLTLQNGLGNLEILRNWKGKNAFGGTTTIGAALISPGVVKLSGTGKTVIGSDMNPIGATRIASAFSESGLPASVSRDIQSEIWAKAIVNACINPITAVLRVPNGRLLDSRTIANLVSHVARECEAVAKASGIRLSPPSMYSRVRAVASDTADNISSMLQDIERGRKTEIRQINGEICKAGEARGISTPLNRALVAMVEALENQTSREKG
ncbi:MAG: ketopantoate reductase family protein [Thermoplasmata archaeon]